METRCRCGDACIQPASVVLKDFELFYRPCARCETWKLKKFSPLARQIDLNEIDSTFGSCNCGKRHLDIVIAHVLKIMMDEGVKDEKSTLRSACTPLITPAYPLNSAPYLPENSVVILSDEINKSCAQRVVNEVDEVKGALKGDLKETAGIKDSHFSPNVYELLAGCDIRCDIVQTPHGALCIHKYQGKVHIELPQVRSPKIEILRKVLEKYETNGFHVDFWNPKRNVVAEGENFKAYSLDIRDLEEVLDETFDICIVDAFPDVDTTEFVEAASKLGREVVVI
jgi:hypothetical protein